MNSVRAAVRSKAFRPTIPADRWPHFNGMPQQR